MDTGTAFQWVPFYEALADKLLTYSDKRGELFTLIKEVASEQPLMKYLHFEKEDWWGPGLRDYQIDPFSVMGIMNRGTTDGNRTVLAKVLAETFEIKLPAPTQFAGIPVMNNQKSFFSGIDEPWELFELAMQQSATRSFDDVFKTAFDKSLAIKGNGLAYITMGLYWIRPKVFMPLDSNSRTFIASNYKLAPPSGSCTGAEYVSFLSTLKQKLDAQPGDVSYPEISYSAWTQRDTNTPKVDELAETDAVVKPLPQSTNTFGINKNLMLYGVPGTGKTYCSVQYAVAIIEEKPFDAIQAEDYDAVFARYLKYKDDGLIAFTTFHQSFGYEEFIEGIRPVVSSDESTDAERSIEYEVRDGVFKEFCNKAEAPISDGKDVDLGFGKSPTVWKVSLGGTGDNPTRTECMAESHIRIGWDQYGEIISDATEYDESGGSNVLNAFYNKMQIGDIVMSCYSSRTVDAIGVITGDSEWHDEYPEYKRLRNVKWLIKGIEEDIVDQNAGKTMTLSSIYKLSVSVSDAVRILRKTAPNLFSPTVKIPNRVFIIDEINRGNISKIFGELITLIEPTKRIGASEQLRAILPYSGQNFGVPDNVYIIGTMNTADRSIARMDAALRRRFSFVEMLPQPDLLQDILVDGIDIAAVLKALNLRIAVMLDREHTIGHSYFLGPLKQNPSLECLAAIFENEIIPLLQEYFYDDYEKIQLVLGDNQKTDDSTRFIVNKAVTLFGDADIDFPEYYEINSGAFREVDAYAFF